MRKITLTLFAVLGAFAMNAQIVINEIMYNNPGSDSLEFVELYNTTANPINLDGYEFSDRNASFVMNSTHEIPANGYFVLASDSVAFFNGTGLHADVDLPGSWSFYNSTDTIRVKDNGGNLIDIVGYDDGAPWPTAADGSGPSLELCSADSNNFDAQFWFAATTTLVAGTMATPGAANTAVCSVPSNEPLPMYMISEIDGVDANGSADSVGVQCQITGIVHCGDFNGGGALDFTVIQSSMENVGIKVYSSSTVDGYVVTEGDSLRLVGTVGFFRGMTQFNPDTIEVLSQGNGTVAPLAITELNESTDSKHLVFENGYLATPSQWTSSGSYNVDVTNGTDTIVVRLDSDVALASEPAPTDTFDIFGLGGQYDTSSPYTSGYQFMACHLVADSTDTTTPPVSGLPMYMISEIDGVNATNEPDSMGVNCQITGIVHCGDFNGGNALDFTIIQSSVENVGIKIYNSSTVSGYTVTEGDSLRIEGTVSFFRGMTQFSPDSIEVLSQGNNTVAPLAITELNESTDSKHLVFENGYLATPSQWTSSGSFNVDVTNGTDTIVVRLDSDVALASEPAPTDTFDIFGLGGQYDTSSPYDSGYQFMACHLVADSTDTTTPPVSGLPTYLISEIDGINATNEPDSLGVNCQIHGVVHCIDFRGNGLEFTVLQSSSENIGIKVFSFSDVSNYTVTEGDSLRIEGTVAFYNGMTQFSPDSIEVLAQNVGTVTPMVVTSLDESTESKLVAFENATLVTPSQWTGSGSGFNVDITDGTNTIAMRIDNESPLYSEAAPTGTFDAIGLGGQFDSSSPYDSGYQLIACHLVADSTDTTTPTPTVIPSYTISEIDGIDSLGIADSLNVLCQITGIVHCQDFRGGAGIEFTVMESSTQNVGIKVFSFQDVDNYVVTEGDELRLVGNVAQFNGHLQFAPDTIEVLSQGNATVAPLPVTELTEFSENKLVEIENLTLVDETQWTGSGSGFNVDVTNGTNTMTMRIDNDSPLYSEAAPATTFSVIGLGGQYDSSEPHTEGYQVYPCSLTEVQDTTDTSSVIELNGIKFNVFPNPVANIVNVEVQSTDAFDIQIVNLAGKVVMTAKLEGSTKIDVSELSAGFYSINLIGSNGIATTRLIKQ